LGISKIREKGEIYWFNHIPKSGSTSPFTWSDQYNFNSSGGTTFTHTQLSASNKSLLYTLLPAAGQADALLYSLPSAWGDLVLTKTQNQGGLADINAASFDVEYDFTDCSNSSIIPVDVTATDIQLQGESQRLRRLRAAGQAVEDVTTAVTHKKMTPVVSVSNADNNSRTLGKGEFTRFYNKSSTSASTVKFTAQDVFGVYKFVGWTNRTGATVSTESSYTLPLNQNGGVYLKANYEYAGAALKVADVITQGQDGGTKTLAVSNSGKELDPLYWTAELTENPSWVHIIMGNDGADDGDILLQFDPLPEEQQERQTTLYIETDHTDISKQVIVKQVKGSSIETSTVEWTVGPNPFRNTLNVNGAEGYIMHLTNIAGRAMFSARIASNNEVLDVSNLPSGVYILTLQKGGMKHTQKVMKL
jgi:hypothetical protein